MWAQVINAIIGIWLMAAPAVFGYGDSAQINDRIIGPVVATFAVVSWWEATRPVRLWNLPLSFWLLVAPWLLGYDATVAIVNDMVAGVLITALALVKGNVENRFGGGWSALWRSGTLHEREAPQARERD